MENIVKGRVLKDTLFGKVCMGTATLKQPAGATGPPREMAIVIKEYNKQLVEAKRTRQGHPVHEDAKNELKLHALLCQEPQSPHIVRLYDLRADANNYYAVLEYCSKGEFFAFVSQPGFTREHARHFFRQLIVGLDFMHSRNIAHRDCSLENILLDENHVLKICDFGVAIEKKNGEKIPAGQGSVGKLRYMAPEVFARVSYCPFKADIWSCGVILFVMLVQVFPFDRPTLDDDRFVHACSDRINYMLGEWKKPQFDSWTIDIFRHIFCPSEQRFDCKRLLAHPYCSGKVEGAASSSSSVPAAAAASSSSSSVPLQQQQPNSPSQPGSSSIAAVPPSSSTSATSTASSVEPGATVAHRQESRDVEMDTGSSQIYTPVQPIHQHAAASSSSQHGLTPLQQQQLQLQQILQMQQQQMLQQQQLQQQRPH